MNNDGKIIIAYVPVLHRGYKNFFEKYEGPENILFIFGEELISEFDHLRKEIRALSPEEVRLAVSGWALNLAISIADYKTLENIGRLKTTVIMPNEDICRELAQRYLRGCKIIFDDIFLRWDRDNSVVNKEVRFDRKISVEELDRAMINRTFEETGKSSDWWRRIGAVIAKGEELILTAHNRHVPSPHMPYVFGDPRNNFKRGVNIDTSTALHAEAGLICKAAKHAGISLKGASLYVTTFPCPACAKLIAYSGIKRCYYKEGYSMLDGETILRSNGVEIIKVIMEVV